MGAVTWRERLLKLAGNMPIRLLERQPFIVIEGGKSDCKK